jgi:adhesin transport system membrane fusion protein
LTANPLDDVDYMPDTYAAEVETVPTRLHLILWTSTVVLVAALVWSRFATLDEVARAEGRVIPSGQVQVVQNLEGGILAEVLTQVGDHVTEGQNLIRLDDTQFASSFDEGQLTSAACPPSLLDSRPRSQEPSSCSRRVSPRRGWI